MRRLSLYILLLAAAALTAAAGAPARGLKADSLAIDRAGDFLTVSLDLDLENLKVGTNRAKVITPRLVNGNDSVELRPLGLYGRSRYIYYQRNYPKTMISGPEERTYRRSQAPDTVAYRAVLPWQEWMNGAALTLTTCEYGCCHTLVNQQVDTLGLFREFRFSPQWLFVRPREEGPKTRALSGRAYIDFPVDQTVIYPDYRRNTTELGKIQATIDSVRNDRDVTITRVWLKGFASPESPYSHNTDLSIGRVKALKEHIQRLYHFAPGIIETDNEPEDWEGLRRFVEGSNLEHKEQILALIDSDMAPDPKEARIKKLYPAEYKFMLAQYYPALRHTDYRIDYNIKQYNDLDEIRSVFATQPSKLSLNELFVLANSYAPGSEEFNEVFATAVRMYPDNPVANLNAATTAMEKGDLDLAARFLEKAGDDPQADYDRGVLLALRGDYAAARPLIERAAAAGIPQAADALRQLDSSTSRGWTNLSIRQD